MHGEADVVWAPTCENHSGKSFCIEQTHLFLVREGCGKKNPEKVWSFAKFGVLKKVKNGLKWVKNDQKT